MTKIFELIANVSNKYGLIPAISILALILGGYGCYQASLNQKAIQAQDIAVAKLEARLDASTKELSDRMGGVEKNLIELTTQIKLLIEGKLVVK